MGTAVVPATMDENLEKEKITKTQRPEMTIKERSKKGKIKWKMLPGETEGRRCINRGEFTAQEDPQEIQAEGQYGVVYTHQHRASIGWPIS
jgi:hypothetical protein